MKGESESFRRMELLGSISIATQYSARHPNDTTWIRSGAHDGETIVTSPLASGCPRCTPVRDSREWLQYTLSLCVPMRERAEGTRKNRAALAARHGRREGARRVSRRVGLAQASGPSRCEQQSAVPLVL